MSLKVAEYGKMCDNVLTEDIGPHEVITVNHFGILLLISSQFKHTAKVIAYITC